MKDKYKLPLWILFIGLVVSVGGTLLKVQKYEAANLVLLVSLLMGLVGGLLLLYRLLSND